MTVFELMLLAGGVSDPSDPASARMAVEQQASILQLQNFSLKIKRARLIAETTGEQFLPDSLKSLSDAASLVEVEASLFEVHTAASESRRTIFDAQKAGYDQEITSITQSITLHDEEVQLLEEQLQSQQALTERGLAALSALRELKRQLTGTRREALEFRTALFRARQNRIGVDQAQAEAEAQNSLGCARTAPRCRGRIIAKRDRTLGNQNEARAVQRQQQCRPECARSSSRTLHSLAWLTVTTLNALLTNSHS